MASNAPYQALPQQSVLTQASLYQPLAAPSQVTHTQSLGNALLFPQAPAQGAAQSSGSNAPLSAEELRVK